MVVCGEGVVVGRVGVGCAVVCVAGRGVVWRVSAGFGGGGVRGGRWGRVRVGLFRPHDHLCPHVFASFLFAKFHFSYVHCVF